MKTTKASDVPLPPLTADELSVEERDRIHAHWDLVQAHFWSALKLGQPESLRHALACGARWVQRNKPKSKAIDLALNHPDAALLEVLLNHTSINEWKTRAFDLEWFLRRAIHKQVSWAIGWLEQSGADVNQVWLYNPPLIIDVLRKENEELLTAFLACPSLKIKCINVEENSRWSAPFYPALTIAEHPLFMAKTEQAIGQVWEHIKHDPNALYAWGAVEKICDRIHHPRFRRNAVRSRSGTKPNLYDP